METAFNLTDIVGTLLLTCGILATLLNFGIDVLAGMLWKGYSFTSQSISALSAVGAPTRSRFLPLYLLADLLMIGFGLGVWRSAAHTPLLIAAAGLIIGNAAITLVVHIFFPIHPDRPMGTFTNLLNVIPMFVGMIFFLLAIGFGAAAFRNWFRFYSAGTLLAYIVLTIFGIWVAPRLQTGPRAPTVGVQERVMVFGYLLWILVLAFVLLQAQMGQG